MTESRIRSLLIAGAVVPLVLIASAGAWYLLDPGFRAAGEPAADTVDMPAREFERRVRDYLLTNPEVIVAALQGLEVRQREAAANQAQAVVQSRADEIFRDPESPVGGNAGGDVTLVEFFDCNCPYCRRMVPVMAAAEAADPQLRVVYKEFPILGAGSRYAAKATLAAHRQGRYLASHRALIKVKGSVDEEAVRTAATAVGLDLDRLKVDMNDPAIQAASDRNLELAEALRINGTPGFVIGGEIVRGAIDLEALQAEIATASARPDTRRDAGGG